MFDSYGVVRLAIKYEKQFERNFQEILSEKELHIETLKAILEETESALELEAENMANFGQNIQMLYTLDDVNTLWKKIQLLLMKWYVNWMYDKAVKESKYLGIGKEKIQNLLKRLLVISAF